jgi:hypothetical protein
MSIFNTTLFGMPATAGLGSLPEGARPLAEGYRELRLAHPGLPKAIDLPEGTQYVALSLPHEVKVDFYRADGRHFRHVAARHREAPTLQDPVKGGSPLPARSEGDGLLPGSSEPASGGAPRWLPYALVGGGVLVASAIVIFATRGTKSVQANRRRRRRRSR